MFIFLLILLILSLANRDSVRHRQDGVTPLRSKGVCQLKEGVIRGIPPPDDNPQYRLCRCEEHFCGAEYALGKEDTFHFCGSKNAYLADLPPGSPVRDDRQIRRGVT